MARARFVLALVALLALVFLAAPAQGRVLKQISIVTPTPLRPFQGPRVTTIGLGGVSTSTVRATPLNPWLGPVTTTTGVRATPFNPWVGPIGGTVVTVGH